MRICQHYDPRSIEQLSAPRIGSAQRWPAMPRDLPVRPDRRQARRRHRRRNADVGLRLSAPRRRMAGILEIHRGAVRGPAGRCRAQDHLRERRQILRPDQLKRSFQSVGWFERGGVVGLAGPAPSRSAFWPARRCGRPGPHRPISSRLPGCAAPRQIREVRPCLRPTRAAERRRRRPRRPGRHRRSVTGPGARRRRAPSGSPS